MADEGMIKRAFNYALAVDPETAKAYAKKKIAAYPKLTRRQVAEKVIKSHARTAAAEGFVTGLPSTLATAAPAAVADVAFVLKYYAKLTAVVGYIADEDYFEDPDWDADALLMLAGPKAVSRIMQRTGVEGAKQTTKVVIKKYLSKEVLKAIKKFVLKWFGKKITQRAIITKVVPVVGGLIGGTWNFAEVRLLGGRILRYHFEGELT